MLQFQSSEKDSENNSDYTQTRLSEAENQLSKPAWTAVYAVSLGVAGLIISEFLPVSLLTPMAKSLYVTEGAAGQAISITSVVAMLSALFIGPITRNIDRRWVLLSFGAFQVLSNVMVAFASNFTILLIGRLLLGIGLGGFWGMSAATAMRLVPKAKVPKALSIIFGAVSVATVAAAPLGSFLELMLGWRNVFLITAGVSSIAVLWQAYSLPSMPSEKPSGVREVLTLLKRSHVLGGMVATMLIFLGYSTFFTYLRPFLELVSDADGETLTLVLLGFGLANCAGTILSKYLFAWDLNRSLTLMPLLMGICAITLVIFGHSIEIATILVAFWGMFLGVIQVGWSAWLTRTLPDEAEVGGGLQIAIIQLAITAGAAIGGLLMEITGTSGVFISSGIFALVAAIVAGIAFKIK